MGQCISKGPAAAARGDSLSISSSFGGEEECSLHSAQGSREVDDKEKISTKKKVRGEYRPILIKSGLHHQESSSSPPTSSTSKGRRVQFFISPSKSDMKKSDIKPKKVSPEVSVEYKLESQSRIRKNSSKKYKKGSSSKNQSIVEPLIENKSPPSKPLRIFTHTPSTTSSCSPTCQRKPLLPINSKKSTQNITTTDEITDKRKFINVSKLPLFKFSKSNNSKNKNVLKKNVEDTIITTTNTHASEIIITLKESSTHNLTGTSTSTTTTTTTINRTINTTLNGNDIISTFVDPTTKTTTTTMGVNFSDDTTKTTTLPQHLLKLGHAERDNINSNIQNTSAIFKTQKTILQESINSSSLNKPNYSTTTTTNNNHFSSNLNDVTNTYSQHLSSTPDQISTSIKSAEKIIAENRLRRNLFFGSPDIQTDNTNININNYTVDNMNGYPKNSIFKKPHDMKQKLKQQQEATIPVPKLYSLNQPNGITTTASNIMKGGGGSKTVETTQSTIVPISKLPTYSGAYNNNSRLPNPCATTTTTKTSSSTIPPSSLFNSRIQNVLPNNNKTQQIRGSQHQIDLPQSDPKVSQWISANDFFKQNPISKYSSSGSVGIKSQQQLENRRETLPSRFGFVGSSSTQRKKLNDDQQSSNNEVLDRRASAYVSTTTNVGRKIPITASGLKKPIQSKPFYEIMMHRNIQPSGTLSSTINNTNKHSSTSTFGSGGIFQGVSTGRVKQAASNIEKKIHESVPITFQNLEESAHHNTTITSNASSSSSPQSSNNSSSLLRSNTWVKSSPSVYIPTDGIIDTTTNTTDHLDESSADRTIIQNSSDLNTRGINTNKISSRLQQQQQQLYLSTEQSRNSCQSKPLRFSLDGLPSHKREEDVDEDNSHNLNSQSDKIIEARKELFLPHETNNSNYPLTTSSTSSSVISSEEPTSMSSSHIPGIGGGGTDNDKAISELGELIDDEIEDQPDLTLTFKDSSLILSPSSSGESLVSCDLMLDYKDSTCSGFANSGDSALLDLDEPSSIMPPNRNKSVVSSIVSTDVLCTSSGVPQRIMVNSSARRSSNQGGGRNGRISPVATSTPINISNNNNNNKLSSGLTLNKISQNSPYISHRDKSTQNLQQIQNNNTVSRQQTSQNTSLQTNRHSGSRGKLTSIPSPIHHSHDMSSSSSSSLCSSKMSTSSETPPIVPSSIPTKIKAQNISNTNNSSSNNNNNNNNSSINTIKSPYRYPRNSSPARIPTLSTSPNKTSGIIRKSNNNEVNNTTIKVINKVSEGDNFVSDSFVKEILTEVLECKTQLEELKSALETTEKEVLDKNEIIERQKKEIEYWKNTALSTNVHKSTSHNKDVDIIRNDDDDGDYWGKEKGLINNMVKETANACSQTESTYQPKPAVSYPSDENDKMGQLVSFRIGRMSSSTSNKN